MVGNKPSDIEATKPAISKPKGAPAPMREEDLAELIDVVMNEDDPYYVPDEMIPEGYSLNWKRLTVHGKRMSNQATYERDLARTKWEPLNVDEHPEFRKHFHIPEGENTVENGGLLLMIRPKQITDKVLEIQKLKAQQQLSTQLKKTGETGAGEAPRKSLGLKRSYESVEVPND